VFDWEPGDQKILTCTTFIHKNIEMVLSHPDSKSGVSHLVLMMLLSVDSDSVAPFFVIYDRVLIQRSLLKPPDDIYNSARRPASEVGNIGLMNCHIGEQMRPPVKPP